MSNGTLKSTLTSTVLPETSISRIVFLEGFSISYFTCRSCGYKFNEVHHAIGIAPLVVVPRYHFNHIPHGHGRLRVKYRRVTASHNIDAYNRILCVGKYALEATLIGGGGYRFIDFLPGNLFAQHRHQVYHGAVKGWHSHGDPVDLALKLRDDKTGSSGCTGGSGNNRHSRGSRASKILMGCIYDNLVVRI